MRTRPRGDVPLPQDSTACLRDRRIRGERFRRETRCTDSSACVVRELVSVPPMSSPARRSLAKGILDALPAPGAP
jgi:hypothetical protein